MKKGVLAIPAAAFMLAACGSGTTHSVSTSSIKQVSVGNGIQVAAGTKAADVNDIRPNPPISRGPVVSKPSTPSTPSAATVNATQPSGVSTSDRCGAGSTAGASSRWAGGTKRPPQPMCVVE